MNILFLLRLWPVFGGGEAMTRLWANEFVKKGYGVHIAYFKHTEYGTKPFIDERIKQHLIDGGLCDEFTRNDVEDTNNVCDKLCEIINNESIDIVINQWLPKSFIKNIKRDTSAKVIWCLRTMLVPPYEKPKEFKRWMKHTLFPKHYEKRRISDAAEAVDSILPYVDKYVFLSEAYRQQYLCGSIVPQYEKVCAIPNPITKAYSISNNDLEQKENIILVVGRMQESTKRFSMVLNTWHLIERLKDPVARNWRLVMVGDGEDINLYQQMAKDYNMQRISFVGFQDPIPYYKKAKILLLTSRMEGFGNVLLEAQRMGVVPIATDSYPAVHDIIVHEYNGKIVPDRTPRKLAKAILSLINNEDILINLRNNALTFVEKFSLENISNQWMSLLNELNCKK